MAKVDPQTPIQEGAVIVRVGADGMACPRGKEHFIYPVIQLIWPAGERYPKPQGDLSIRWQDKLDATKPSKSQTPKYIGLVTPDGDQWIGYRVSDKDRELFESLRQKWGMWFLAVRRQGDKEDTSFTYFNDGGFFAGSIVGRMPEYVQIWDAVEMRQKLVKSWQETLEVVKKKNPFLFPDSDAIHTRFVLISKIPSILEEIGGGPLPWVPKEMVHWGKPDGKAHDEIVALYIQILGSLKRNSENKKIRELFQREYGEMYSLLRRAKIFEISPESYVELHLQVDRYITEDIAQLTFHDPREPHLDVPEGEGQILWRRQLAACEVLPFPEKLPFDVCWFAMAGPMVISELQAETRGLKDGRQYMLIGIIAAENGEHHELLLSHGYDQGEYIDTNLHIVTHRVEEENSWQHALCLAPFVLHALVDSVNDYQTTIVAQRKLGIQTQGKIKKGLGDLGLKKPIPPPFYTVHLRDKVIHELVTNWRSNKLRAKYAHRFDVRGHWCFKIYRGQMPMDAELELHLDKLHYNIFKTKPLDEETIDALRERGQPPRQDDEWIAIKKFWRNPFVKGPEDGPYIPSTRVATKGVLAFDNEQSIGETGSSQ